MLLISIIQKTGSNISIGVDLYHEATQPRVAIDDEGSDLNQVWGSELCCESDCFIIVIWDTWLSSDFPTHAWYSSYIMIQFCYQVWIRMTSNSWLYGIMHKQYTISHLCKSNQSFIPRQLGIRLGWSCHIELFWKNCIDTCILTLAYKIV